MRGVASAGDTFSGRDSRERCPQFRIFLLTPDCFPVYIVANSFPNYCSLGSGYSICYRMPIYRNFFTHSMDIHPNIDYTCHCDSSLYVVIPIIVSVANYTMTGKSTFCKCRSHFILYPIPPDFPKIKNIQKVLKVCSVFLHNVYIILSRCRCHVSSNVSDTNQ